MALAASDASDGRAYNVGSGVGARMIDLAREIVAIAGAGKIVHVEWPALAARIETGDFVADVSRMRDEIGWAPSVGLREGLQRTVSSYRVLEAS